MSIATKPIPGFISTAALTICIMSIIFFPKLQTEIQYVGSMELMMFSGDDHVFRRREPCFHARYLVVLHGV
jgi:hypothetical protein